MPRSRRRPNIADTVAPEVPPPESRESEGEAILRIAQPLQDLFPTPATLTQADSIFTMVNGRARPLIPPGPIDPPSTPTHPTPPLPTFHVVDNQGMSQLCNCYRCCDIRAREGQVVGIVQPPTIDSPAPGPCRGCGRRLSCAPCGECGSPNCECECYHCECGCGARVARGPDAEIDFCTHCFNLTAHCLCRRRAQERAAQQARETLRQTSMSYQQLMPYSFKPTWVHYALKHIPSITPQKGWRYYGMELEVNGPSALYNEVLKRTNRRVICKTDGSLVSGGFEIVTHPHTFHALREFWRTYFMNPVRGLSAWRTGECGCHIHIGRLDIEDATTRRMVAFCNTNRAFVQLIAQRADVSYAMYKIDRAKPSQISVRNSRDRREVVNLINPNTIELRMFRGSYRLDRVLKNLDFADVLVEFCKVCSYQGLTVPAFYEFLSSKKRTYKYLWAYLEERGYKPGRSIPAPYTSSTHAPEMASEGLAVKEERGKITPCV